MKAIGGAILTILISVGCGFAGQAIGHAVSGGEKNVSLRVAFAGLIAGAALTVIALAWLASRQKDWRLVVGGLAGAAIEALVIAGLVVPRYVSVRVNAPESKFEIVRASEVETPALRRPQAE
jgi:hypothetical protein